MVTELLPITVTSCIVPTMQENRFLLFLNHLRLPYSIPKSFALLLSFHIARHTFATTITLVNKVSLENVAKMMGHASTRMTQHYARVLDQTIMSDMEKVQITF